MVEIIIETRENKIAMKAPLKYIKLSLEGNYGGVSPGDEVVAYGDRYLVVGFSGKATPFTRKIWMLRKREDEVRFWKEQDIIKVEIIKAPKPMTAKMAVEIIDNFQNS